MKLCRLRILSWVILLPFCVSGQTPPVEPTEPRPAATPNPDDKTKASAPARITPETQFEIGGSYERLSNDRGNWQSYFLNFNHKFSSAQLFYGSICVVHRFEATDGCLMLGLYQPIGKSRRWSANFEATGSPRHQVLATVSLYGQIEHNFGAGWLGHAGLRHSRYSNDTVNIGVFGVERYFKAYRGAYTLYLAHLNGGGTSASHVFQGNYYYGERNSVGLGGAFGQEIESVGNGQLVRTDVREVSVTGRHWLNQNWGLSYVGVWHRQGTLYTRSGAQVGLLLRF